jgi:hypothetical protein
MSGRELAQGVASLGRNGESMLVHMQPREVAGLQALAMQGGGSLTINPETGLPEAGWFGDILGAVAPIALGAALGPAGMFGASGIFGMGALGAGLTTGLLGYAITGDIGKGIMSGFGGYGGANLGQSLAANVSKPALVDTVTRSGITNASSIPGATGVDMLTSGASDVIGSQMPYVGSTGQIGANMSLVNPATSASEAVGKTLIPKVTPTWGETMLSGAKNAVQHPVDFFKGPGTGIDALTIASVPMAIKPKIPGMPEDTSYKMKYEGPYSAQDRMPRTPTQEEMTQLAAAGSPEYNYFGSSNPYPGFNKAPGYAAGGMTTGGAPDLFGSPDGTAAQNTLKEGYGLGRLNNLAQSASQENAKEYGFDMGGAVPYMPGAASYGIAPTDLSEVAKIGSPGEKASTPNGLSTLLGNAITDPMGRTDGNTQGGMGGKGGQQNPIVSSIAGGFPGKGGSKAGPKGPELTMQDYINAATRTYNPNASMTAAMDPTGVEQLHFNQVNPQHPTMKAAGGGLQDGGFVVPADVVSHLGNGSTDAGLAALQKRHGAQPIRGAGDGMSDSIKTTINGKQPARIANGEAYIPPEQVKRSGGAKKFYAMMDKVRKERTGTKKQGKQINPNKFMTA